MISILNGISYKEIRSGVFDKNRINKNKLPLFPVNIRNLDVMLATFKQMKREKKVSVFFIDQLSHIEITEKIKDDLTKRYNHISSKIEKFAKDQNVCIFLNVQDGRGGKGNMDSGSISWADGPIKDADFVYKINKYVNLTPEEKKAMGTFIPKFPEYTSVVSLPESRHSVIKGTISAIQTYSNKSMLEIWSANTEFNTKYQMQKETI